MVKKGDDGEMHYVEREAHVGVFRSPIESSVYHNVIFINTDFNVFIL